MANPTPWVSPVASGGAENDGSFSNSVTPFQATTKKARLASNQRAQQPMPATRRKGNVRKKARNLG